MMDFDGRVGNVMKFAKCTESSLNMSASSATFSQLILSYAVFTLLLHVELICVIARTSLFSRNIFGFVSRAGARVRLAAMRLNTRNWNARVVFVRLGGRWSW